MKRLALAFALAVTAAFPLAAQAEVFYFHTFLDGPSEAPPNLSPATGASVITFDTTAHTYTISAHYDGLLGTTTQAHIHGPTLVPLTGTRGIATELPSFTNFQLGVTSGTYSRTFDTLAASTYNTNFINNFGGGTVAGAEAAFLLALQEERAYLNIHSTFRPGGEIRGFFVAFVPEPGTWALMILGFGATGAMLRRRRVAFA